MKVDRWQQVDHLLDEALALPQGEREAFLVEVTDSDEDLRREVLSLLKAHDRAEGNFLDSPALEIAARGLAARREDSLIGKRFGAYQIISILGVGGMGEVYLARDERLGRRLALKILPSQFVADSARVERFAREARAVSALNHPNIVTVYDIGQLDGAHFIAMEHVDGQTLREKIQMARHQPLDEKDVVEIALQISAALAAAHEAGIIHRDIKPENLMMRRDDYIKVLDFGLAKLTENHRSLLQTREDESDPAATTPGTVLGTLRYMSPEQAMGIEVDARSDIFNLGVVLYELLTGSPPFKGDTPAAILDAVTHHTPLALTQLRPDLNPELARVVGRMLEKDRERRYQSAEELRLELKRLKRELDSSPAHSLNNNARSSETHSVIALNKLKTKTFAFAVIGLALCSVAVWQFWRNAENNAIEPSPWFNARNNRLTNFLGEELDPHLSPDGKVVYYSRRVKGQWDVFWQRTGGSKATNLTEDSDSDDSQPACSPDGASLVFRSERNGGGLFLMGATGESVRQLSRFGHNPTWSPDSKFIVCGTDYILDPRLRAAESHLLVINVANGQTRELLNLGDAAQPHWSPNGKRIAYYHRNANNFGDVWTVRADGSDAQPATNDAATDWNPLWSPDGNYLYFASNRKAVGSLWRVRVDETTGRALSSPEPVTSPTAEIIQADLARDGRHLVYGERLLDVNLKTVAFDPIKLTVTGAIADVTKGTRPSSWASASPDGKWVAFHSMGSGQDDIWLTRADGSSAPVNFTDDAAIDRSPSWSPDGSRIAFFSNRNGLFQIWQINPDGSSKRELTHSSVSCTFPFWSPDGRLAYSLTNVGVADVSQRGTRILEADKPWEQQTPVALPSVNETDWFNGHSWSPDGQWIAGTVLTVQDNVVRAKSGIYLYSLATRRYEQITNFGIRPEWLNDSHHLAFTYSSKGSDAAQQAWIVNIKTKVIKSVFANSVNAIATLRIARDGRRLFFSSIATQADLFLLSLDK